MEEKLTCSPNGFNGDEFIMMKFMVKKLTKAHFEQQTGHVVNVVPFSFQFKAAVSRTCSIARKS